MVGRSWECKWICLDVNDVPSILTYDGIGNTFRGTVGTLRIEASLQRKTDPSTLEIDFSGSLQFATKTVRVIAGQTVLTEFDSEGVNVIAREHVPDPTNLETFCPDYDLAAGGPLFVDSPGVRRWNRVTVAHDPQTLDGVVLQDANSSTPISGATMAFPPSGLLPEALYTKDLVVDVGAVLKVGEDPNGSDLNIYYTGSVTNNGSILDKDGNAYTPIQLKPTLYGDFDADGEGNELADVTRFNDAFPSDSGDPEYDALVDWDCDGDIDCDDRTQYVTNWNPTGLEACP